MTGKTHQIFGLTVGLATFFAVADPTYAPATLGTVFVFSYLGALLPDIDNAASDIWHTIPFGHHAGKIIDPFLGHRAITHSVIGTILACTGIFFLLKLFPSYWGINTDIVLICAAASYISHILADSFTVEGIPLFWPTKWKIGIPPYPFDGIRIMTGKWFESLIIFPLVNLGLILLIVSRWSIIKLILFK